MSQRRPMPRASHRLEVLAGRLLAAVVHPVAAWRSSVRAFRVLLLAGYFAAGYVTVLAALVAWAYAIQ